MLSAGINISSALAILAGVSSAGPIGLFLGTGLMISNSFYNVYRTVEEIEEKVALTTSEEWETGFRAILGLQPDYSVRNKLLKQQTYSEIKEYKIEKEKKLFTELLKPSGYNLSIVVDEDEQVSELPLYHLFDKKTNLYLFKNKNVQYDLEALKHNFNILTLPINLWKQQQIDNIIQINKRKFTAEEIKKIFHQYPDRYEVEVDKIKTYIPLQSIATNEIILLNREYDNLIKRITNKPFLGNYLFRQANAIYSLPGNGQPEYIFESLDSYFMKGVLRKYITGSNFNLGDGDDIAVGLSLAKNRFVSYSGRKIFIGGEQDDVFILAGNKLGYGEDKYFNGKGGNDTIIVEHLPRYHSNMLSNGEAGLSNALLSLTGTFINLQQGTVRFLYEDYLDNFENISSFNNSHYISDVHVDLVSF
ncbi:hypothetical protein [Arsenophonus nasoniae]|uniref:RTX-family protein n=1 Tax=Arsenophonus nasoniae TaxID=638 RepID=A0AA95GIR7_9GAMM|nr:hypothetical protein [Arsenophonus nasoniae]WGL96604.1 hypothetical protein QE207_08745 [Arsenophonus nasoniae]